MNKTLLLVDDSLVSRIMVRNVIEKVRPDWDIVEANNGDEALRLCTDTNFDAGIIDQHMEGIEGFKIAEQLQELFPDITITIFTADIQDAMRSKAEELSIGFINKPVQEAPLLDFIDKIEN